MELILFALIIAFFVLVIVGRVVEPAYMLIFNKPLFVHFYISPKRLPPMYRVLLSKEFAFYRNLSPTRKIYFEHRINKFIETYQFAGREGLQLTDEMKIKIAATSIMLTFGMRDYLSDLFSVIIIYPDVFESKDGALHKGEFNPFAKAVVFSWKHFQEGLDFDNDNLNLGLHEFAHVLHFQSVGKRRPGASAIIYSDMFNEIMEYINDAENRQHLAELNYFRLYAYTNKYEFIAVILEYFFETPAEFRQKLPELYRMVKKMINFREG